MTEVTARCCSYTDIWPYAMTSACQGQGKELKATTNPKMYNLRRAVAFLLPSLLRKCIFHCPTATASPQPVAM